MAMPITSSPTLKGKEARAFVAKAIENENKRAPKKEVENAVKLFCSVMKNHKESLR